MHYLYGLLDSGGGAGIQADLKTFQALGVYGTSVITSLTSQNTLCVDAIESVSPSFVSKQIRAVVQDIGCDAIKIGKLSQSVIPLFLKTKMSTGMLNNAETVMAVVSTLKELFTIKEEFPPIVVDPVMVSTSNHTLLETQGITALIEQLLPLAYLITPNLPEAQLLAGEQDPIDSLEKMKQLCKQVAIKSQCANVLLKGGHASFTENEVIDLLYESKSQTFSTFSHR